METKHLQDFSIRTVAVNFNYVMNKNIKRINKKTAVNERFHASGGIYLSK